MTDNATATARLVFTPSGKRGDFPIGTPVLQAARRLGVDIDSLCGGNGMCGRCQIVVIVARSLCFISNFIHAEIVPKRCALWLPGG